VTWETDCAQAEIPAESGKAAHHSLGIVSGYHETAWGHALQIIEEAKELVPGSKAFEFAVQRFGFRERLLLHRQ
jgi:hypothetical protein